MWDLTRVRWVECRPTAHLCSIFRSILCCRRRLHLSPSILVFRCPHLLLQISFPVVHVVLFLCGHVATTGVLECLAMLSLHLLRMCPRQIHSLRHIWFSTGYHSVSLSIAKITLGSSHHVSTSSTCRAHASRLYRAC